MLHGLDSNRSVTEFDSGFVPDVPKIFAKVSQEFVIYTSHLSHTRIHLEKQSSNIFKCSMRYLFYSFL